ncbi:somatomedin-B and thrombospondin type-1 domain-containing protein, partial [Antrostomus carolinensis]|uniref:somatomedin-B and thrombospondin type-1 domain-containing protein n=1 Tax=Antrostomus carolinensis TaxID=279965 RepID=UPI000529025A
MWSLLLCGGWLLATGYLVGAMGSCWHQCCPGRNNACWAPGARRARCYCDSYCERTGDCCEDYHAACRHAAVGCAVGPWGPWSGCSSPCGVAKILPDSFSRDFRDPWRRSGLLLPEEPSG